MINSFFENKKAQGLALTWFFAFIIIFFIMLLFVGIVASVAAKKGVGKNEISSVEDGFNLISEKNILVSFLNSLVDFNGEEMTFKELILKWNKDSSLKNDVEAKISEYFEDEGCYALSVYDNEKSYGNLFVYKGQIQSKNFGGSPIVFATSLVDDRWVKFVLNDGNELNVDFLEC